MLRHKCQTNSKIVGFWEFGATTANVACLCSIYWCSSCEKAINYSSILPMLQRHPRSSPDCPTRPLGLPGRSGTGSGTAKSHAHDRRSSSVSCRSAASAQSGTGASHIADEADKVNCNNKHFIEDLPSLQLYLHTSNILFSASR